MINLQLEELLKEHNITKAALGRELGYKSPIGIYKALRSKKMKRLITCYVIVKILSETKIELEDYLK